VAPSGAGSLPYVAPTYPTADGNLTDDILDRLGLDADAVALSRRVDGEWRDVTIGEFHREVTALAKGLNSLLVAAGIDLPRSSLVFALRTVLVSLAVGLLAIILLGMWLNHAITRSISGEYSVEEHQKAQELFADEPGVVSAYHDWMGEITILLAPSSNPARDYAELVEEMDSYFAGRKDARAVIVIDDIAMKLIGDASARTGGLHLIGKLGEVDGLREAQISLSEDRGVFRIDVTGEGGDKELGVIDLYEDVRRACVDAGCGPDVITYVSVWGSPRGYIKDSTPCDCADGGSHRGTGMRHELLVYERYADRHEISKVTLSPGRV
jgi:hypothetical protein